MRFHCDLLEYVSSKKYKIKNTISSYTLESYYLVLRSENKECDMVSYIC